MAELAQTSLFSDPALKAYYKLENVNDSTAHGFTLTNHGTVGFAAAKFNNGASLGAANSSKYLDETAFDLSASANWSISLWVKMSAEIGAGKQAFFYLGDASGTINSFRCLYNYNAGTRRIDFIRRKQNVANDTVSSNIVLGTTDFHHIVYVYNGSVVRGYIDNVDIGTVASTGDGNSGTEVSAFALGIENDDSATYPGNYLSGIIDDVGVFTKALSAAEVNTLFSDARAGGGFFSFFK